jgi:hypothetical protein
MLKDLFNRESDDEREERKEEILNAIKSQYKKMGKMWNELSLLLENNTDDLSDDEMIWLRRSITLLDEAENELKKLLRRARKI